MDINTMSSEIIQNKIITVRGHKVMLDRDLALSQILHYNTVRDDTLRTKK
jgi:hypothetical protein